MKDAIVQKLEKLLGRLPIIDEAKTVYLLVEVRKILDQERSLMPRLSTLRLYCDWVVHSELCGTGAQEFLQAVYPWLEWKGDNDCDALTTFNKLMTLGVLREELLSFLNRHSLPTELCECKECWISFVSTLAEVAKDCRLLVRSSSVPKNPQVLDCLPFVVRSVAIEPLPYTDKLSDEQPFPMKWMVEYRHKDEEDVIAKGEFLMTHSGVSSTMFAM